MHQFFICRHNRKKFSEAKVILLGEIAENLHKNVVELEAREKPSALLEVLEERRKAVTKAVKKTEEAETLCAKFVDQASQTWEALIDDNELEKVVEELCRVETKETQLKYEMKKLPLAEKMDKAAEMKKFE